MKDMELSKALKKPVDRRQAGGRVLGGPMVTGGVAPGDIDETKFARY